MSHDVTSHDALAQVGDRSFQVQTARQVMSQPIKDASFRERYFTCKYSIERVPYLHAHQYCVLVFVKS